MAVAGMFYDGSPDSLRAQIRDFFSKASLPDINGEIKALVVPHAGYVYSGFTAAHAYKTLKGCKYDCIILIGPSHRDYFYGISVYPGEAYSSPFGKVPINKDIREELMKFSNVIVPAYEGHRSEHCLEVQLPFLQYVLDDFSFVPLIMGEQDKHLYMELSKVLVQVSRKHNLLLVASSDLSHYHPASEAEEMDKQVIQHIESFDSDGLMEKFENRILEACGAGPIAVVMKTAKEISALNVNVLHYCNSGDITGDRGAVVGYLSAVFYTSSS